MVQPGALPAARWSPSSQAHSADIPAAITPLVGRDGELSSAVAILRRAAVRLLTLTGPGGVGKTRLAIAIADALRADYPDGVCFVSLGPVHDPALLAASIAQAL